MDTGEAWLGARIRILRERAGLQAQELAEKLGLDPSAMSNIERGKRGVKAHELTRISEELGVSPLAILDESSILARLPVAPRVQAVDHLEGRAFERLRGLAELHEVLANSGIAATPQLEDVPIADLENWRDSADAMATWAAQRLNFSSEGDATFAKLLDLIEKELHVDVQVDEIEESEADLAGAAITEPSFPLIFVSANQPRPRALFTLAHELGHVLACDGETLTIDLDLSARDDKERFANAFAASFLMPEARIRSAIEEQGRKSFTLAILADELGVSFESLIYRLHNLRLINAEGRDRLRAYGLQGVLEHVDDKDLVGRLLRRLGTYPETRPPTRLMERAFEGFERGLISIRPLAGLLGKDPDQLLQDMAARRWAGDIDSEDYHDAAEGLSDDEIYSGDPV